MWGLSALAIASPLWAQTDPEKVAPQVIVNVRKHPIGADMVQITAAAPDYPKELLAAQAKAIGANLDSEARGLEVYTTGTDPKFRFVKAGFATDGLIDRESGSLRLQALVRAFLGAPAPHQVKALIVTFEGEKVVDGKTLKVYANDGVSLKATESKFPPGIEYRIVALTQEPDLLSIPDKVEAKSAELPTVKPPSQLSPAVPIALIGVAAVSGAALVYLWLSGRKPKTPAGSPPGK